MTTIALMLVATRPGYDGRAILAGTSYPSPCRPTSGYAVQAGVQHVRSRADSLDPEGRADVTKARLSMLALAAGYYCMANGHYPASENELRRFRNRLRASGRLDCLADSVDFIDAWDRPLRIAWTARGPLARSPGVDGRWQTADDVVSPMIGEPGTIPFDLGQTCRR
jgi:hypothetical protein